MGNKRRDQCRSLELRWVWAISSRLQSGLNAAKVTGRGRSKGVERDWVAREIETGQRVAEESELAVEREGSWQLNKAGRQTSNWAIFFSILFQGPCIISGIRTGLRAACRSNTVSSAADR